MVRRLFPASAWTLGDSRLGSSYRDEWIKAVRICDELTFDRYFSQSVTMNEVSESDLAQLFEAVADGIENAVEVLRGFDQRRMLLDALRQASLRVGELSLDQVKVLGQSIFDVSDEAENQRPDAFPPVWTLCQVATTLIHRFDAGERAGLLREWIKESAGLTLPVYTGQFEDDHEGVRGKSPEIFMVDASEVDSIIGCVRDRLRDRFADPDVVDAKDSFYWFGHWIRWDEPGANAWLRSVLRDPSLVARFLPRFMSQTQVWGSDDKVPQLVAGFNFAPLLKHITAAEVVELVPWDVVSEGDDDGLFQALREALDTHATAEESEE
jgi:hypothetical protein